MNKFIPLIVFSFIVLSCNESSPGYPRDKIDTTPQALFRLKYPNGTWSGPILDSAITQTVSRWVFKDSAHSKGGHWVTDTNYFGRIADDTARDAAKKPIFDSSHHPVFHYVFYTIQRGYIRKFPPLPLK